MRLNTSALHEALFPLRGVAFLFLLDAGWDASGMGEMNISRLAMPTERPFWLLELGLEPLRLLEDVELDVMERGEDVSGTSALVTDAADEVVGLLAAEDMLSLLLDVR